MNHVWNNAGLGVFLKLYSRQLDFKDSEDLPTVHFLKSRGGAVRLVSPIV